MRRVYTVLLMVCAGAITANAQPPIGFGVKAGPNISTINVDGSGVNYDARAGFHAGVFLRGRFDSFGVQPELLLFTQGGDVDFSILGTTAKEKFTYISLPIILKYYPVENFNIQLGPQIGYLIDGEREFDTFLGSGSRDIKDQYKDFDIAISAGLGYEFTFGLSLDARYNFGVMNINDAEDEPDAKSRVFIFSVGWNFLH